jgi:hypothetical protein
VRVPIRSHRFTNHEELLCHKNLQHSLLEEKLISFPL